MMRFFHELRRRKVTRVAAIYALVAWAAIESSSVIFPALGLPDWTVTFIVALALLGFPVALIFAWIFDWTREGIVRTPGREELPEAERAMHRRGRAVDFLIIAVLLVVVGWLGWERMTGGEAVPEPARLDSIAVLPFVNMSGDPENEYFGDGLAEELLNALVRVDGLRVAARTSSFEFKGQHQDIRRIGQALGVAAVLEGSVRKAGERVRVTAQLIRAEDGFHLWSETYDRKLEDIFAVQDDISLAIVEALRGTLETDDRARVTARPTEDIEAFEAYLRGRYEMNKRTSASLARATGHFQQAIARDPGYAAAYSGLSDTWILRGSYGGISTEVAIREAEPLARKALELEPTLGEAHASLGLVLRNKNEIEGSIGPFLRAIELNPSYSPAYHWLGLSYKALGRFDDAVEVLRKAVEVDPQYMTGKRALLGALRDAGHDAEADALGRRIAREHPADPFAFLQLSNDALGQGQRVDAFRHIVRAVSLAPTETTFRVTLSYQLLLLGDIERARQQIDLVRELNPDHPVLEHWDIDAGLITQDPEAFAHSVERVLAMPPGETRDNLACNTLIISEHVDVAVDACRSVLARDGWQPGDPIPPHLQNTVGNLLLAAIADDDRDTADELIVAFEDEFDRMEAGGMRDDEIRWGRALIAAHRDGDHREMLALLPGQVRDGHWNWRVLNKLPVFAPIREEPGFIALVEELREAAEQDLARIQGIELPGV